jgi:hypothetical protein
MIRSLSLLATIVALAACAASRGPVTAPQPAPAADRQAWLEMFARGYFPGRSGQVFVVPKKGDFVTERSPLYRFMHGSPHEYDTRIPVLFHGSPFVNPGRYDVAAAQLDVAPTMAAIMRAPVPATMAGRVLAEAVAGGSARPRIVTLFVLDAMRADYFELHADAIPTLRRLRDDGAWFSSARATVLPTLTSVGHATLGTGAEPRVHGVTVNNLFNHATGKPQEAYNGLDTHELMALTLADTWNLETRGAAVIIGHGGAIRATVGLVGHGGCLLSARKVLAASYGGADGGWETNPECYVLPPALVPLKGRAVWEAAGGTWMGHDIANASRFRASSPFQKFEAEALRAVVEESAAGADDVTDLVLVNMKGPDYTAHMHGPRSKEMRETLAELDRQIAAYLALLDRKAGPGRSVTVITADHGMPDEPPPGGRRYFLDEIIAVVNKQFDPEGRVIQYYNDAANNQMHLDTSRLRALGFSLSDVARFLERDLFAAAFTEDEVRAAQARLR